MDIPNLPFDNDWVGEDGPRYRDGAILPKGLGKILFGIREYCNQGSHATETLLKKRDKYGYFHFEGCFFPPKILSQRGTRGCNQKNRVEQEREKPLSLLCDRNNQEPIIS